MRPRNRGSRTNGSTAPKSLITLGSQLSQIMVSKQSFGQGAVESFNDGLIAVNIHTAASNLDIVFREQLIHRAHKLTAGIHLKQFRPIQRAPAINPFQSSCHFSSLFCGQRFGRFVSRGDINHGEGALEGFTGARGAIMWKIPNIGLVNGVWKRNIEFRSWYVPRGR